jgi:hypothetical protein
MDLPTVLILSGAIILNSITGAINAFRITRLERKQ